MIFSKDESSRRMKLILEPQVIQNTLLTQEGCVKYISFYIVSINQNKDLYFIKTYAHSSSIDLDAMSSIWCVLARSPLRSVCQGAQCGYPERTKKKKNPCTVVNKYAHVPTQIRRSIHLIIIKMPLPIPYALYSPGQIDKKYCLTHAMIERRKDQVK